MFTQKNLITALSIFISVIFIQSLLFKFTNAPETQFIFGTIADWIATLGVPGLAELFRAYGGYVVGTVELAAALLLLRNVYARVTSKALEVTRSSTLFGALIALEVMTGAIFFHLFTPLGINVQNDGGALFAMAVLIWFASAFLITKHKDAWPS